MFTHVIVPELEMGKEEEYYFDFENTKVFCFSSKWAKFLIQIATFPYFISPLNTKVLKFSAQNYIIFNSTGIIFSIMGNLTFVVWKITAKLR